MAEYGVAALSHVPSGERVRTGSADPSGAWDQDHPPSTATTTQESGLRENRTSRLSERTEEGRKPDLLRLYIGEVDEQRGACCGGADGGKGRDQGECGCAKHGPDPEPGSRVPGAGPHTRSCQQEQDGEADGASAPHHHRRAAGCVPRSEEACGPRRRCRGMGGVRGGPGGEPSRLARTPSRRVVSSIALAPGVHPEGGWQGTAARHCCP